ncbi:hypothetical protein NQD34_014801 [Periophthalmus magnuspinnatus]|nr:hypothetical protein NQD34_014801 [Periophthalmus magnuspinnatus]
MSRQRSRSPNYRSFPWEEPDFDPHKIVAHMKNMSMGQREADYWREEDFLERRHPEYQQYKRHSEENYHMRRLSPYHKPAHFEGRGDGLKGRETYRENTRRYEDMRGPPQHKQNYEQRDPGWRRDQNERESRERYRDRSPIRQEGNYQRGRGRGQQKRKVPVHTDTWTPNQDNPELNRSRDMDGSPQFGYRWEKPHGQRFSVDDRRDGFDRNARGPLEFEQNRNDPIENRPPPPRREHYSHSWERDFPPRPRSPRSMSSGGRRGSHFEENDIDVSYHEARRSPITHERPTTFTQYTDRPTNRGLPTNRGRGFNRRSDFNRKGRGRGTHGNLPQQQGDYQNALNKTQRGQFMEGEFYDNSEPAWEDAELDQEWRDDRRSTERRRDGGEQSNFQKQELEMPQRSRELHVHNESKPNMMVITEETLTIKVDMSRPVNKNSAMLYSADRQLSLDLVHVGRQRLDFLSTPEGLRSNRENAIQHTGTFAQEIITLTHLVKDLYFRGKDITLNERFSAPQKVGYDDEEPARNYPEREIRLQPQVKCQLTQGQ